jgi:hypothetical protein
LSILVVVIISLDDIILDFFVGGYAFVVCMSFFLAFDFTDDKIVSLFLILCETITCEDYGKKALGNAKLHGIRNTKSVA